MLMKVGQESCSKQKCNLQKDEVSYRVVQFETGFKYLTHFSTQRLQLEANKQMIMRIQFGKGRLMRLLNRENENKRS